MSFVLLLKTETHLSKWAAMFVGFESTVWRVISGKDYFAHEVSKAPNPCSVSTYRHNLLFTGVDDTDLLVLAGGAE